MKWHSGTVHAARHGSAILAVALVLAGCGGDEAPQTQAAAPRAPLEPAATEAPATPTEPAARVEPAYVLEGDDTVLATVDGEPVTRYDVDAAARTMLGDTQATLLDAAARRRVLESLVTSRAIARRQLERMDAHGRAELEKRVAAYREQLLVKAYLEGRTTPRPVTQAMVEAYYARHPEQFGARSVRTYEMLFAPAPVAGSLAKRLSAALAEVASREDWEAAAAELSGHGLATRYRRGRVDARLLEPALQRALGGLAVGEASAVVRVDGRPHLVRVLDEQQVPPRPLDEVSAEIRRMLVPVQISSAVEDAARTVLADAKVEYRDGRGAPDSEGGDR